MNHRVWVLGPEMELIENLLHECGESVIYALDERGERIHPGSAYRCPVPYVPEGSTVYAVECVDQLPEGWVRIDHHRPGDPGYGRPPSEFFEASSIGQVVAELARLGRLPEAWKVSAIHASDGYWFDGAAWWMVAGDAEGYAGELGKAWRVPHGLVLAAAADHCLAAAYRGECPGVDPDELMRWRAESRAKFQGRSVEELLADVERAREALRAATLVELSEPLACDYHGATYEPGCGACTQPVAYDLRDRNVPELPEAAAREGASYLATVVDRDGREKVVLGGAASPEMVREFMEQWAPAEGLVDIYGDPARGFAGGYLPA